jgi:hypothetical protein
MTTTLWIAMGAILAAYIARGVKISEFRQAWIDGIRADISEFMTKAHEWIDLYREFNSESEQKKKAELAPKLDRIKYDSFHVLWRIRLRFKPDDSSANALLDDLQDLLDPGKLMPNAEYATWRTLADNTVLKARALLKEEWEVTKNPFRALWHRVRNKLAQQFAPSDASDRGAAEL